MTKTKGSMTLSSNSPSLTNTVNKRKNSQSKADAAKTVGLNKTDTKKNLTKETEIIDCNICNNEVDELSIQCDTCSQWSHQKCTTLSRSEFEVLQQGNHHIVFNCGSCLQENSKNKSRLERLEKEVGEHSKMIKTMNEVIMLLRDQNQTLHQQNDMIVKLVNSDKTLEHRIKAQIEEALDDQK